MEKTEKTMLQRAGVFLAVAAGSFLLGRESVGGPAAPAEETSHAEETGHEAPHEEGAVFDAAGLKLAGIQVEPLRYQPLAAELPVAGSVEPTRHGVAKVGAKAAGKVASIEVAVGEHVAAGALLGTLESSDLSEVQATVVQARAEAEAARSRLERANKLLKEELISRQELEEARAQEARARAAFQAAEHALRVLGAGPQDRTLPIRSPIAGSVTERLVSLGETVTPDRTLFTVIDLSPIAVALRLPERELSALKPGQAVSLTADSAPETRFKGSLSTIGSQIDELTRTATVWALLPNEKEVLKPGMFVRGVIAVGSATEVLSVPQEAVQMLEGNAVVFVQGEHEGEFHARPVELGKTTGGRTVITAGLSAGEPVVVRGAFMVKAQAMKSELGHEH